MYIFSISETTQTWTYNESQKMYKGAMCLFPKVQRAEPNLVACVAQQRGCLLGLLENQESWSYFRLQGRHLLYYRWWQDSNPCVKQTLIKMFLEKARWAHFLKPKSRGWRDSTPGPGIHHQSMISKNSQGRMAWIRAEARPSHGFQAKHFSHNQPSLKML